jgi:hypothetical protein
MNHIDYGEYDINATGSKNVLLKYYTNHTIPHTNGFTFT